MIAHEKMEQRGEGAHVARDPSRVRECTKQFSKRFPSPKTTLQVNLVPQVENFVPNTGVAAAVDFAYAFVELDAS
jgi:hypothetical protein